MARDVYMRQEASRSRVVQSTVCTKLLHNYRRIRDLQVPTSCVYDRELIALPIRVCENRCAIGLICNRNQFPILFPASKARNSAKATARPGSTRLRPRRCSVYSESAALQTRGISLDQIAVISPYRKQVESFALCSAVEALLVCKWAPRKSCRCVGAPLSRRRRAGSLVTGLCMSIPWWGVFVFAGPRAPGHHYPACCASSE